MTREEGQEWKSSREAEKEEREHCLCDNKIRKKET